MEQLTISAMSACPAQQLIEKILTDGIELDQVEAIDFAGLQLLIALYIEDQDEFMRCVRGKLSPSVLGDLLREGGAFRAASTEPPQDLAPLWSHIQ